MTWDGLPHTLVPLLVHLKVAHLIRNEKFSKIQYFFQGRYCSVECQNEDWEQHKDFCNERQKRRRERRGKKSKMERGGEGDQVGGERQNEEEELVEVEMCRVKKRATAFSEVDWLPQSVVHNTFSTLFRMKLHIYDPCWIRQVNRTLNYWGQTVLSLCDIFRLCATFCAMYANHF